MSSGEVLDSPSSGDVDHSAEIGRNAVKALKWSVVAQLTARAGSFGLGLVLARLLTPAEFGTYTVALGVFLILLTIDDLGVLKGLVRWPGKFEDAAPTARTLGTITGLGIYGLSFVLAPYIARTTSTPGATSVIRVLCLGVVIDAALQIVPGASLQRRFRQDLWVLVELSRLVVVAVATIWMAAAGLGVWSLTWGSLIGQVTMTAVTMALARIPLRYEFNRAVAKDLIRVSAPYAVGALIGAALLNVDYLVIGRILGPTAVGVYLIAFNVSSWPTSLVGAAVRAVAIPGFSQLRTSGADMGQALRKGLTMLLGGAVPFAALLIAAPALMIGTLYGERWVGGAPALQFLALMTIVRLLDGLVDDALFAGGHSNWIVFKNVVWLAALGVALTIGAHVDGIRGVAIGHAIVACGVILPLMCWVLVHFGMWRAKLAFVAAVLVPAGAVAGLACWLVRTNISGPHIVMLGASALVLIAVYAALLTPLRHRLL